VLVRPCCLALFGKPSQGAPHPGSHLALLGAACEPAIGTVARGGSRGLGSNLLVI
jgi:hypothetical protein